MGEGKGHVTTAYVAGHDNIYVRITSVYIAIKVLSCYLHFSTDAAVHAICRFFTSPKLVTPYVAISSYLTKLHNDLDGECDILYTRYALTGQVSRFSAKWFSTYEPDMQGLTIWSQRPNFIKCDLPSNPIMYQLTSSNDSRSCSTQVMSHTRRVLDGHRKTRIWSIYCTENKYSVQQRNAHRGWHNVQEIHSWPVLGPAESYSMMFLTISTILYLHHTIPHRKKVKCFSFQLLLLRTLWVNIQQQNTTSI